MCHLNVNTLIQEALILVCYSPFNVFVDKEAPAFEVCPDNQTLNTEPGQAFAVATWQNISATDNSGDVPEVACDPQSESKFTIGQTSVTCAAVDGSGNNNTCSFQITVEGKNNYSIDFAICHVARPRNANLLIQIPLL